MVRWKDNKHMKKIDGWLDGWIDKIYGWLDGYKQKACWMDRKEQVNSWKDEKNIWMVGWMDEQKIIYI